jgi:hypothetical protein
MGGRIVPSRMKMMPSLGLSGIVRLPGCNQKLIIEISVDENCAVTHIGDEHAGEGAAASSDFDKESRLQCYRTRIALTVL